MHATINTSIFSKPRLLWGQRREASLNWLALGLLLAAWNAAGTDEHTGARHRPEALRAYSTVSVRAVQRVAAPGAPCG